MGRFVRWVPKEHAPKALELGLLSHNKSAMWIFDLSKPYRPGRSIYQNALLLAYDLDKTATDNIEGREHIDYESEDFEGEGKHPMKVIVKNNEVGAYGIGRQRQGVTNLHTRTSYATKKEVAKALGLKEIEVSNSYRPPTGWP